jgi:phosphoribosylformylglycinamidine synthase
MKARVHITLKQGVLDPQGKAIAHALGTLGFSGIDNVRQGKLIELDIAESDPAKAHAQIDAMCKQLLANTVIEDYSIDLAK